MAYTYITTADLERLIKGEFLVNIVTGLNQAELDKEESLALATVFNRLRSRYDVTAIKALSPRDPEVLNWVLTIMVYNLHRRQNNRAIPNHVSADYDTVINWLKEVQEGKFHPDLPALPLNEDGSANLGSNELRYGSKQGTASGNFYLPD